MKVLPFIVGFLFFLCPFPCDTFYPHYLDTVARIQRKDSTALLQMGLLATICAFDCLHFLYLFSANLTPAQRLIHFDFAFYIIKGEFNWMGALIFVSGAYLAYKIYFAASETNNTLLLGILEDGDTSFFLYSQTGKGEKINQVIQGKMKVAFNLMQSILAIFELATFGSTIYLLVLFYLNHQSGDLIHILLNLTLFFINGILLFSFVFYYLFLLSLIVSIAMAQFDTFLFKLKQLLAYLRPLQAGQFRSLHYSVYRKALLSVLVPFHDYNRLYGPIFIVFLVCNCPINAFLVITLLHPGSLPVVGQIYLGLYCCLQLVAFFIMHLYLVSFSKHFHAPSYLLLRLHGQSLRSSKTRRRVGNARVRLQIAGSIEAFHTKRRYGLTYGHFGLVTLRSFITFLLLYGKLLMTVYRRIYL